MREWSVVALALAGVVGAIAFGLAMNVPAETHAKAGDVAMRVGATALVISFGLTLAVAYQRRRVARLARDREMNEPLATLPANAVTPEGWEAIKRIASLVGVEPAGMWYATRFGAVDIAKVGPEDLARMARDFMLKQGVLRILADRPASSVDSSLASRWPGVVQAG
jgi:hypothetical protein